MTDKKLEKDKEYYTCQHQQLAEKSCNTCDRGGTFETIMSWFKCSKCQKSLGKWFEYKGTSENSWDIYEDCYQIDKDAYACVSCYEKDSNQERESKIEKRDCWFRSYY